MIAPKILIFLANFLTELTRRSTTVGQRLAPPFPYLMSRPHRILVGTLCVLALLTLPGWVLRHENAERLENQQALLDVATDRNREMAEQNRRLLDEVNTLLADSEHVEHEARERLGWVRPGEVIVTLPEPPRTLE
jgi:cell division protein FtsB